MVPGPASEEKALGHRLPNYEYGQSAVATFKKLLTAAQPDVEFVAEQATPGARWTPAAWCRRWLMPNRTPSSTCCSRPISPSLSARAMRGLFQGRAWSACSRVSPSTWTRCRARRRWAGGHRLPLVRHLHTRPRRLLFAAHRALQDYPRAGSVVGYNAIQSIAAGLRKAGSADTEAPSPPSAAWRCARRSAPSPTAPEDHQSTMGAYVGKTGLYGGKG